jgi:hypothetical protein
MGADRRSVAISVSSPSYLIAVDFNRRDRLFHVVNKPEGI